MAGGGKRKINQEIQELMKNPLENISITPNEKNCRLWQATVIGPADTPYAGGVFLLDIVLPKSYPKKGPRMTCVTKIYHMSINGNGKICLDLLIGGWNGQNTSMRDVFMEFYELLKVPHTGDAVRPEIAAQYIEDTQAHDETAREWTQKFATAPEITKDNEDEKQAAQNGADLQIGKEVWIAVVPDIYVLASDPTDKLNAFKYGTEVYTVSEIAEQLTSLDKKDKMSEVEAQFAAMTEDEAKFVDKVLSMDENKDGVLGLKQSDLEVVQTNLLCQLQLLFSKFEKDNSQMQSAAVNTENITV